MANSGHPSRRVSDDAVRAKTGRTWAQWFKFLDRAGGRSMDHKGLVARLKAGTGLSGWWQQMVTVTYEQARGLRQKHETPGGFQVSVSRTVNVPVETLFEAWQDARRRARWLGPVKLTVRKSTPLKSMRINWSEPASSVDAYFLAKGGAKSQMAVQHSKLADARQAARMKAFWAEALKRMKARLESR